MAQQQMKWSALIDQFMALQRKLDSNELGYAEFGAEFRKLMSEMAEEIKSNPYGKETK